LQRRPSGGESPSADQRTATGKLFIGVSVLGGSLILFFFRRIVQDRERPHWREETPAMPGEPGAPAIPAVPAG